MDNNTDGGLTNIELSKLILICMISSAAYSMYSWKKNYDLMAISLRDIEKALEKKKRPNLAILLPECYHNYLDIFSRTKSDKLPSY